MSERVIPAWSLTADAAGSIAIPAGWPESVTRDWAIGDATGDGCRRLHPRQRGGRRSPARARGGIIRGGSHRGRRDDDHPGRGRGRVRPRHGVRGNRQGARPRVPAPSIRVLGEGNTGSGELILGGLRHAIERGFDIVNLSLSTTKRGFAEMLHELADSAYFQGTVLVASAHNMPVESYPWRFSSVISVGSHEGTDSFEWYANPSPPVEFFARGIEVDVAWAGGGTLRCTGNSFAAPHIVGLSALVLSKHPGLTPFQLKSVLYLTATNTEGSG